MSLSNSKNCGIAVYWSGVSSPGVCGDGDCPDDAASKCSWGGTLTVVNNKTTPIAINISNAWGGWGGFCPNVPPGGECQRKVFPQAACGDGVQGYINITDWGPWGTDCQASLTFICDRCPASYHE
ncbi:MAG: hypothetical protein L6Q99_15475 [Planctomycetes bacterium]|nr:hypothetical protein [Planctomycetota bacterium]